MYVLFFPLKKYILECTVVLEHCDPSTYNLPPFLFLFPVAKWCSNSMDAKAQQHAHDYYWAFGENRRPDKKNFLLGLAL